MKHFKQVIILSFLVISINAVVIAQHTEKEKAAPKTVNAQQEPSVQEIAENGIFDKGIYKNKLMGFSITIPANWSMVSEDMNRATLAAGRDKITANKSEEDKKAIDNSMLKTKVLFQTMPFPPGSDKNTASIICGVERPGSSRVTQEYYADVNKKLVLESSPMAKVKKEVYPTVIGDETFSAFEIEIALGGQTLSQTYYVTKRKNLMFFFILNLLDDTHKETLANALGTVKFDK